MKEQLVEQIFEECKSTIDKYEAIKSQAEECKYWEDKCKYLENEVKFYKTLSAIWQDLYVALVNSMEEES